MLRKRTPSPRLVSATIRLPGGHQYAAKTALAAIDRVHVDGHLPEIPLVRPKSMQHRGFFFGTDGIPTEIWVRAGCEDPEFTLLHEIGHFIDFARLGRGRFFAGSPQPPPACIAAVLIAWDLAIQGTSA